MNMQSNKQMICEVLMEKAANDRSITVLCSDSRGSGPMTDFAAKFPEQFVEIGIAEQNAVGIASGMAKCGKKVFVIAPASFLSARSYEQIKVDVSYSEAPVVLIGISAGVSYGALGMTHHSLQDIAALYAVPNIDIYVPSDRFQTKHIIELLINNPKPAYVKVGRQAVSDIYSKEFKFNGICPVIHGNSQCCDLLIAACGEMVMPALKAKKILMTRGISAVVLDIFSLKPIDSSFILKAGYNAKAVLTIEEHSIYGGLGAAVAQIFSENHPKLITHMALPDSPVIAGTKEEVFHFYHLTEEGIVNQALKLLQRV